MKLIGQDTLKTRATLTAGGKSYTYFSIPKAAETLGDVSRLPVSLKILLENILRFEDGTSYSVADAHAIAAWLKEARSAQEVPFRPARILMQDFTGVPAVVDLAAMRDGMLRLNGDPQKVNPLVPVDLVIDHSVMVDFYGHADSLQKNVTAEFERNGERYAFLRWGQEAFQNFRVVPPGAGICHQVNLEYIAQAVWTADLPGGETLAYPDTLYGTDSHTTMVNGIGVLGWGVGGIEAEAAMLGQPIAMLIPDVIGFRLTGRLPEGATATDLVLTVTQILRRKGVVGKFVEFFGPALDHLAVADRATIGNMAPEYGATCGFFPVDNRTLDYLRLTGRDEARIELVEAYLKEQGMFRSTDTPDPVFTDTVELDLGTVVPSLAGPKRPQDRVSLKDAASAFIKEATTKEGVPSADLTRRVPLADRNYDIGHGDVVIAAITSCTNTSNPYVLVAAGLVARKARALGLHPKPWVKTSLAPGSQVVTEYLDRAGLSADLDALGFETVGYGCTTCIGNSGPLDDALVDAIEGKKLVVASVLSGNRNFEGRVHANVRANYLASPPLVVAYALLGNIRDDITTVPIGVSAGAPVYLRDIWPTNLEIADTVAANVNREQFIDRYSVITRGTPEWQALRVATGSETYRWSSGSTYVKNPPYFETITPEPAPVGDIRAARILALLGDNITTDHISPAGNISKSSPAGEYLLQHQVGQKDFNSYGSRRGNHEIMMRGTFANIRIKNEMAPGTEGGVTTHYPSGDVLPIYDAAMRYAATGTPLVVFGGKEYGMGSSRDWAAKGTMLLGIKAVIAESFERIHRSNLVGMGVLPLLFPEGITRRSLNLHGDELIDVLGLEALRPRMELTLTITRANGTVDTLQVPCRVDTLDEVNYYRHGGILHYVLRGMAKAA
ncbi:MAG: aconitate hydratase AcnA [Rhodospirillales bacterium]